VNFSPEKILLVGMIALLVLGPNRLPQAARTAGRLLSEFRRFSASLQNEVSAVIAEPRDAFKEAVGEFGLNDLRNPMGAVRSTIRSSVTDLVTGPGTTNGAASANGPTAVDSSVVSNAVAGAVGGPAGVAGTPPVPDDPSLN
jgi:sec-independent protein translocase protein TatB